MRINEDYLDDDMSKEKTFDLSKKITEDVPEIEQRLRDIDFSCIMIGQHIKKSSSS